MERVVITGMGVFSGLGKNTHQFWSALCKEQSTIAPIHQVNTQHLRFKHGAEVNYFNSHCYFEAKQLDFLDRFSQFALLAAREAVIDSEIPPSSLQDQKTAVITGSAMGGKTTEDNAFYSLYRENKQRANPTTIPNIMANAGASHIAHAFGIIGPTYTLSTACASSTHAIGQAFWLIRHGLVTQAITGGSEAPFALGQLKAWESMRIIAPDTCRPFSRGRGGMILGEGGAMLVLESYKTALARGAHIYAEIIGFGMSSDAKHITSPCSKGQQRAIHAALNDANISHQAIQYINAHGTGTQLNDKIESETIQAVFGSHTDNLAISSTKGAHGHLLGAAGAIETVATALALHHQRIPPTLNFLGRDEQCNIPICTKTTTLSFQYALKNSFAFGGLNASLALKGYEPIL
ncbi:MAG TPA: beta-ACP synthase [Legionella sp.]|nr:beta-ACP synthase [Legionella sp.]